MTSVASLAIGIAIGAAIVGIVYGVKRFVEWCSDTSYQLRFNRFSIERARTKCDELDSTCKSLLEHGTEVLKTFASVHERLMDLETWMNAGGKEEKPNDS